MNEHQLLGEILHELRELKEVLVSANDDALAALQAVQATIAYAAAYAANALQAGGSDDISAGVNAVTADLQTVAANLAAATPAPAAPATESSPVDTPTPNTPPPAGS